MKKIHVALIDDNINLRYDNPHINQLLQVVDGKLIKTERIHDSIHDSTHNPIYDSSHDQLKITHATICAQIIIAYSDCVNITNIQILFHPDENKDGHIASNNLSGSVDSLSLALDWCLKHRIDVINLSLGSQSFLDIPSLRAKINQAAHQGIPIICAGANNECVSYPAIFSNVIAVRAAKASALQPGEYHWQQDIVRGNEIIAFSEHHLSLLDRALAPSNSFAAPMITAMVCNLIHQDQPNTFLNHSSCCPYPDWIQAALIVWLDIDKNISTQEYYFKSCQMIRTVAADFFKSVDQIIMKHSELDTIVLISEKRWTPILDFNQNWQKHLILIHREDRLPPLELPGDCNIKLWDSGVFSKLDNDIFSELNRKENSNHDIEIASPMITITFGTFIDGFAILKSLQQLFSDEDMYTYIFCNQPECVLFDMEYIPYYYIEDKPHKFTDYIRECVNKRQIDMVFISIFEKNSSFPSQTGKLSDEIIKISYTTNQQYLVEFNNQPDIQSQFDSLDNTLCQTIFNHILSLYEVEEQDQISHPATMNITEQ